MERWNAGRGSSWSYRHEIGSSVSSSSGTIVSNLSTAYASSGSRFSTFSIEAAMHFDSLGIHDGNNGDSKTWWWEEADVDRRDRIRSLVLEFFGAPPATCSFQVCDMSAVEKWLTELGVGWLLNLEDGASAEEEEELDRDARTWIRALDQIMQTLCFTRSLFPDCGSMGLPGICEEEGEPVAENSVPDRYHLVLFIQETMLKMLGFVDVVVAWDPYTTEEFLSMDSVMLAMLPPYSKLFNLLVVHDALSEASNKILALLDSPTSVEVQSKEKEIAILLSAYKSKASEAIRSTMEKIRTKLLEDGDDSPSSVNPQGSSDIHKVTRSVMTYIRFLWANYSSVDKAIRGEYVPRVPRVENIRPLDSMIMEVVSCLLEKLANISESFLDQGLGFLFLINNSYNIQQIHDLYSPQRPSKHIDLTHEIEGLMERDLQRSKDTDLTHKIEGLMERYLQVSWALLLSCLFSPTPLCFGKNYSPLSKFESEFQKMYTTQKQWKVPDPRLRRRMCEVITNKIIPGYTEYIEDNKVTNPKISPLKLEAMLQELFEG